MKKSNTSKHKEIVLPELRVGDRIVRRTATGTTTFTIARVCKGTEFIEPIYRLRGSAGVVGAQLFTGEQLAAMGYDLVTSARQEEPWADSTMIGGA